MDLAEKLRKFKKKRDPDPSDIGLIFKDFNVDQVGRLDVNKILDFLSLTEIFFLDYGIFQVQLGFFQCFICH